MLHVHIDSLVNAVILQRTDHLQTRSIADMSEPRISVAAEISLQNPAILCAVEQRTPGFQLAHAVWRFLRVQLGHARLVDVLAAAHRIGEVHFPIVALIDIRQRCGNPALSHHRVRLAKQRFANESDPNIRSRSFNRSTQARAARAND